MKIIFVLVVMALLVACAPAPAVEKAEASTPIPKSTLAGIEGNWEYECDVLGHNLYTWTGTLYFTHAEMVAQVFFNDLDTVYEDHSLAFIIKSPEAGYEYDWLIIDADGNIDPELANFNRSGLMEDYPGGYPAFEQELKEMNIDWPGVYTKARNEFLFLYFSDHGKCLPRRQPLPGEVNA